MRDVTVFFDLETGGVDEHHPDIQIAAIAVREWEEVGVFEKKIAFDAAKADPEALKLNSFNPNTWRDHAAEERAVAPMFGAFLSKHASLKLTSKRTGRPYSVARLAGHNAASFDVPRLRRMFQRNGDAFLPAAWWYPLDTLQRALWYFAESGEPPPENFKLSTLCEHFGIATEGAHDALADVRMAMQLAKRLCEGAL